MRKSRQERVEEIYQAIIDREDAGLPPFENQSKLADEVGLTQGYISQLMPEVVFLSARLRPGFAVQVGAGYRSANMQTTKDKVSSLRRLKKIYTANKRFIFEVNVVKATMSGKAVTAMLDSATVLHENALMLFIEEVEAEKAKT